MKKSTWNYYGVKLIYRAVITGEPIAERLDEDYTDGYEFIEESVMLVRAQSFDHAYTIAEKKALDKLDIYTNLYGRTVEWTLVDAVDCYLIGDELTSGTELYSDYTPVKAAVDSGEYIKQKYNYSLADDDWNDAQQHERYRLQKALWYEQFSKWRKE